MELREPLLEAEQMRLGTVLERAWEDNGYYHWDGDKLPNVTKSSRRPKGGKGYSFKVYDDTLR